MAFSPGETRHRISSYSVWREVLLACRTNIHKWSRDHMQMMPLEDYFGVYLMLPHALKLDDPSAPNSPTKHAPKRNAATNQTFPPENTSRNARPTSQKIWSSSSTIRLSVFLTYHLLHEANVIILRHVSVFSHIWAMMLRHGVEEVFDELVRNERMAEVQLRNIRLFYG